MTAALVLVLVGLSLTAAAMGRGHTALMFAIVALIALVPALIEERHARRPGSRRDARRRNRR